MKQNEIYPSSEIWRYFKGHITVPMIISAISDVLGGYHISYSAMELLKDLKLVTPNGQINKSGKLVLAHELHERFHRNSPGVQIIIPKDTL